MIFKSRKDNMFKIMITSILLLFCFILFTILSKEKLDNSDYISLSIISSVGLFLFWTFNNTFYEISNTHFKYQSGFLKGTITIKNIHTIIKGKTVWVGLKPATAKNGLIIKYNKYDEIYISPKTNDTFIIEILKHNPNITITS